MGCTIPLTAGTSFRTKYLEGCHLTKILTYIPAILLYVQTLLDIPYLLSSALLFNTVS